MEGAVVEDLSVLDLLEDFFDFLDFFGFWSELEDDLVDELDLSSAANVPRLIERANMAMIINENNFFMELPP